MRAETGHELLFAPAERASSERLNDRRNSLTPLARRSAARRPSPRPQPRGGARLRTPRAGLCMKGARSKLPLQRERVEVRAARVAKVGRGERAPEVPDEVHLGVERCLRGPGLGYGQ